MLEVQASANDMAGANRLEQIRASLQGAPVAGEIGSAPQAATTKLDKQQQSGTA
jgi:hypothetical protein